MELSFKHLVLLAALLLTALSAGLFYAWEVSVIPGTRKLSDACYLQTMQSINRAILNPGFYLIFFGSLLAMVLNIYFQYQNQTNVALGLMIAAMACYTIGTFGVTVFGNVPLNEALDKLDLTTLSVSEAQISRQQYESQWNMLHTWRTVCAVAALVALQLGALIQLIKS